MRVRLPPLLRPRARRAQPPLPYVAFSPARQVTDEYAALNPSRVVPTLVIDGHTLGQSVAILEYLDETRPERSLLPKDAYRRALVRQIVLTIAADTQPVQNLRVLNHLPEAERTAWANHWITVNFEGTRARAPACVGTRSALADTASAGSVGGPVAALERLLQSTAGKYCVGDEVTQADVCLVPQVYNAYR